MEKVLNLAEKLGEAIAMSDRFKALRTTEENVAKDEAATKAQEDLEKQLTKIGELEGSGKPVEVADKRELDRLQEKIRSYPSLQALVKAQADYFEMMNKVNETIVNRLRPPEKKSD